jgi:hypothetical protein
MPGSDREVFLEERSWGDEIFCQKVLNVRWEKSCKRRFKKGTPDQILR